MTTDNHDATFCSYSVSELVSAEACGLSRSFDQKAEPFQAWRDHQFECQLLLFGKPASGIISLHCQQLASSGLGLMWLTISAVDHHYPYRENGSNGGMLLLQRQCKHWYMLIISIPFLSLLVLHMFYYLHGGRFCVLDFKQNCTNSICFISQIRNCCQWSRVNPGRDYR